MAIFSFLGVISSLFTPDANSLVNVRMMTIVIASLFGDPVVGIPAAVVSSIFRRVMGGPTALPCSISTIRAGLIGSASTS